MLRKRKKRNCERSLVFLLLFLALFAARTDQGVIPAIATTLKKQFNMNSVSIGSLGSMVFLGSVVGSLIAIPLLDLIPTKLALMSCLFWQSLALFSFTFSTDWYELAAARFLSGVSAVILSIFLPVWVDAFAPSERKTTWMTLIIVAAPKGMLMGYGMAAVILSTSEDNWYWAFYAIIFAMVPIMVTIFFVDNKHIDIKEHMR